PKLTLLAKQVPGEVFVGMAGGALMLGGVTSWTVTFCVAVLELPLLSRAVQVTIVTPLRNCAGALLLSVTPPQLSVASGEPKATLVETHRPGEVLVRTGAGAVSNGGELSCTVTFWVAMLVLPLLSRAVQVTTVRPFGNW